MVNIILGALFLLLPTVFVNIAEKNKQKASIDGNSLKKNDTKIMTGFALAPIGLIHLGALFIGASITFAAASNIDFSEIPDLPTKILTLLDSANLWMMGLGILIPAAVALLCLIRPIRVLLSKLIPIDPHNAIHTLALIMAPLLVMNTLVTVGVGLDALADSVQDIDVAEMSSLLLGQNIITVLVAFLGVGWLTRRSFSGVLKRLALFRLTLPKIGIGAGIGLLLLGVMFAITSAGEALGWVNQDVLDASEALYGPLTESIWGIALAALVAPIGEEILFRGAIQPKFGRFATALLFTIVHANYGFGVIAFAIFVVGYGLALVRERWDTTTSIVTHGVYNGIQVAAAYLFMQYPDWAPQLETISSHIFG